MNKYKKRNTNLFILLTTRKEIMRSFKEFLEEELISEDDDKKEEKKESKKDSEKESEKKDKDKKEEKKEKKEEEIVLDMNDGYPTSAKIVFGKSAYIKHLDSLDKDDDEYEEKIKPMVYTFSFGGKYRAKFESTIIDSSSWVGSLNKGISSETKEQGLVLSTIMDILDDFTKGEPDTDLAYNDIEVIYFDLYYNDEVQLKNYKKMFDNLDISRYKKSSSHRERRKRFSIILTRN